MAKKEMVFEVNMVRATDTEIEITVCDKVSKTVVCDLFHGNGVTRFSCTRKLAQAGGLPKMIFNEFISWAMERGQTTNDRIEIMISDVKDGYSCTELALELIQTARTVIRRAGLLHDAEIYLGATSLPLGTSWSSTTNFVRIHDRFNKITDASVIEKIPVSI